MAHASRIQGTRQEQRGWWERNETGNRARLRDYLEQCEDGPLSIHYGIALSIFNNYEQRAENTERFFKSLPRYRSTATLILLLGGAGGIILLLAWPGLPDSPHVLAALAAFCAALTVALPILYILATIVVESETAANHLSQTRTDIQTLHQLIDRTLESDQEQQRPPGGQRGAQLEAQTEEVVDHQGKAHGSSLEISRFPQHFHAISAPFPRHFHTIS